MHIEKYSKYIQNLNPNILENFHYKRIIYSPLKYTLWMQLVA
jgi:hypothetical protein